MKMNKRRLQLLLMMFILAIAFFTWYSYASAESEPQNSNDEIIRFHVIANSNSKEDQALKLKVRDAVLDMVNDGLVAETVSNDNGSVPVSSLTITESRTYIKKNIDKIAKLAEDVIAKEGYGYKAKAKLGICWIPEKTYGDTTFPAGNYEALNITIGSGNGQNWWCVLFPPLCIIDPENGYLAESTDGGTVMQTRPLNMHEKEDSAATLRALKKGSAVPPLRPKSIIVQLLDL